MPKLNLDKNNVPFLLGGKAEVSVDTGSLQLNQAISEATPSLLHASFKANGNKTVQLGQDQTVKVGVSAQASVALMPVFSGSAGAGATLLQTYGMGDFFTDARNSGKVVLVLDAGGSADVSASGSFSYSALKATVQIDAGANGGYTYLRALDKNLPIQTIVPEFFKTMRLPEQGNQAPEPGEAISLRYGGYIQLGAELSAGYSLSGTKQFSLGQVALSEKYNLSILGKIGFSARVAGDFSILATRADKLDNWVRVRVHRHGEKSAKCAADVTTGFNDSLNNLPSKADEFLGAVLGVNAKSVLSILQKAQELSDFEKFKAAIDGLAQKYISELVGKGFGELADHTKFNEFLGLVNKVVTSYQQVEDRAVTLFDKYFDHLDQLTGFLDKLQSLKAGALDTLRKDLTPDLWNILSQLTDGDPLGFLLKQVSIKGVKVDSIDELKKRAQSVLSLIRDDAHKEIRGVIGLAKQSLGIDKFLPELAKIDTPDELRAVANEKVGMFVTRLVGRTLDSSPNIKLAFNEVHAVLSKVGTFKEKLYSAFKEAVNSSYKLALHAEYSRASASDALLDVLINMADSRGSALLAKAGKGDFEQIILTSDTGLVRLQESVLTHKTRRESAFKVNILGWHLNYNYEGFDRVITDTEQRLVPSDQGIMVLTTGSLEVERLRKRNGEQMHVDFLLRALGESKGVIKSDKGTRDYLIDTLNSLTARYQLSFTDTDTSEMELRDGLAFAKDLGMDRQGATLDALQPFLPRAANGGFGNVEESYDVRFKQAAINALLSLTKLPDVQELMIRRSMRMMVLANYLKSDSLHDMAFAYATAGVFKVYNDEGFAQFAHHPQGRVFNVQLSGSSISAPAKVNLSQTELKLLATLYGIEQQMIEAIRDLYTLLGSKKSVSPSDFEQKLGKFGDALKEFDKFDQTTNKDGIGATTIFAMFDTLVRLTSGEADNSVAMLRLTSQANGKTVEKVFLTGGFADDPLL